MSFILVGNKCDCEKDREISFEEGENFARKNEMLFVETSAKTGMNVEKTFTELGEEIYSKVKDGIIDLSNDVSHPPTSS